MKQIIYLHTRTSLMITYAKQFIDFEEGIQIRTKYFDFFFLVFNSVCPVFHGHERVQFEGGYVDGNVHCTTEDVFI